MPREVDYVNPDEVAALSEKWSTFILKCPGDMHHDIEDMYQAFRARMLCELKMHGYVRLIPVDEAK